QSKAHGRADVLEGIDRRHREVTALDAGTVTLVAFLIFGRRVPGTLDRIDRVRRAMHVVVETDAVKNEEFVLGSEEGPVGDTGGLQIRLGALGERSRVALIALHGRRL